MVTGGSGFLGGALVRELLSRGHAVRVLDNHSRGRPERLADLPEVELMVGDLRDAAAVREATSGVDFLWHLGAVNGTRNFYERPDEVIEVGIAGALHTVQAAIDAGVSRYIFASSSEVYHQPEVVPTPERVPAVVPDMHNARYSYAGSKIAGELLALHLCRRRGVEAVIVRPHNVYGPAMGEDHVVPQLIRKLGERLLDGPRVRLPIEGDGSQTRAFCYVDDAARGVAVSGLHGIDGGIYNVGREDEISIRELALRLGSLLNLEVEIVPGERPAGGTLRRCPDVSALRALGWSPRVSLREGLERTLNAYLARDVSSSG
ncbi:MAG: NAD-dependent epimerase/dehydratase family protein [Deltaproteobacteria bacterium]|nr:NAD-dependent epimerase/dehydratase family protein [Deltaproteobacteria bacterium]